MKNIRRDNTKIHQCDGIDKRELSLIYDQIKSVLQTCSVLPRFDLDFIDKYQDEMTSDVREVIEDIKGNVCKTEVLHEKDFKSISDIFGPDWIGNALYHDPVYWYKELTEPNITGLIVKILSESPRIEGLAFIRAISAILSKEGYKNAKILNDSLDICWDTLSFKAETCVAYDEKNKSKRIDIEVKWKDNIDKKENGIIIEAKFGHKLYNELEAYFENFDNSEKRFHYILLISKSSSKKELDEKIRNTKKDELIALYRGWKVVYWQELLPVWEDEILKIYENEKIKADEDIKLTNISRHAGSLRRSIFDKIYGG